MCCLNVRTVCTTVTLTCNIQILLNICPPPPPGCCLTGAGGGGFLIILSKEEGFEEKLQRIIETAPVSLTCWHAECSYLAVSEPNKLELVSDLV